VTAKIIDLRPRIEAARRAEAAAEVEAERITATERRCADHLADCRCDACRWLGCHGWEPER
jgi:hypothetical protein